MTSKSWIAKVAAMLAGLALSACAGQPEGKPVLYLIGDSTVNNGTKGQRGWGQEIGALFDTNKIEVVNRARGGRSSRTFLTEGLWSNVLNEAKAGDFVIMQFGHNDNGELFKGERPRSSIRGIGNESQEGVVEATGKTETVHTFGWYLRRYITDAKAKGVIPIVCSLVPRNDWKDGKVSRGSHADWARDVAQAEGVAFIDLNAIVTRHYEELGQEKVKGFFPNEHTHTDRQGAMLNARCVIEGIRALAHCPLAMFITPEQAGAGREIPVKPSVSAQGPGESAQANAVSGQPSTYAKVLPEGNYDVTITLGGAKDSVTTVKAESRRLMLEAIAVPAGGSVTRTFTVNIRTPSISGGGKVSLKPSEIDALRWDDKLEMEFLGRNPSVRSLEVKPATNAITVFLAGDSTVTEQGNEPWAGWGQMLPRFFRQGVAVANIAQSGLTLGSFKGGHRLDKILSMMKTNDYLFIQFGHNDQKEKGKGAGPFTSYKANLKQYVAAVRAKGGVPVIVTPMERRRFDDAGKAYATLSDYAEAARQAGAEEKVPVIDLNAMSLKLYQALGPEQSKKAFVHYPAGTFPGQKEELKDNTHHNVYGGYELARCIVEGIKASVPSLATHLRDDFTPFDPAKPDPVERLDIPPSSGSSIEKPAGS